MAVRFPAMPADVPLAALNRGWCRPRIFRSTVPTSAMSKESSVYETRMAIRLLAMPADAPLAAFNW